MLKSSSSSSSLAKSMVASSSHSSSSSSSSSNNNNNNNNNSKKTATSRDGYRYHRIPLSNIVLDNSNHRTNNNNNNDDDDDDDDDVEDVVDQRTIQTIDHPDHSRRVCIPMMTMASHNHKISNHNKNDDHDDDDDDHRRFKNYLNFIRTVLNEIRIPSPILMLKFVKNVRCLLIFILFVLLFVIQFKSGPFNNNYYYNHHHPQPQPQPQPQLQSQLQSMADRYGHNGNSTANHGGATVNSSTHQTTTVINDTDVAFGSIIPLINIKTSSSSSTLWQQNVTSKSKSSSSTINNNKDDHHHHQKDNNDGDDHEIVAPTTANGDRLVNTVTTDNKTVQLKNCPLVPPNLVGRLKVLTKPPEMDELEQMFPDVELGGRFRPKHCHSHNRVAIIVPYRDRDYHLRVFLMNLHPMLMRQNIDYGIYIVEQYGKSTRFNRAKLMNVGFLEASKQYPYDCFIFHDVDLIPEDDRNLYTCPQQPRHMSVAIDKFHYRLPYKDIFGGVSALTKEQFRKANGFSNEFWGWGGEDDDMSNRIHHYGFNISRYPTDIARYKMLKHENGIPNSERFKKLYNGWRRFKTDGINTIKYKIVDLVFKKLYTWIYVDLLEPKQRPFTGRHQKHRYR